jgi:hypothetical protein
MSDNVILFLTSLSIPQMEMLRLCLGEIDDLDDSVLKCLIQVRESISVEKEGSL